MVEKITADEVKNFQEKHMNDFIDGMMNVVVERIKTARDTTVLTTTAVHMNRFIEVGKDIFPEMVKEDKILYFWRIKNILKDWGFTTTERNNCLIVSWDEKKF